MKWPHIPNELRLLTYAQKSQFRDRFHLNWADLRKHKAVQFMLVSASLIALLSSAFILLMNICSAVVALLVVGLILDKILGVRIYPSEPL